MWRPGGEPCSEECGITIANIAPDQWATGPRPWLQEPKGWSDLTSRKHALQARHGVPSTAVGL